MACAFVCRSAAGTSAAQLDALQQQLEEVNGRLLRSCASELVGLMLPDILQPPHRGGMAQVGLGGQGSRPSHTQQHGCAGAAAAPGPVEPVLCHRDCVQFLG